MYLSMSLLQQVQVGKNDANKQYPFAVPHITGLTTVHCQTMFYSLVKPPTTKISCLFGVEFLKHFLNKYFNKMNPHNEMNKKLQLKSLKP